MSRKRRKDYQRQLDSNVEEILAELSRVRMQQLRCIEESYRAALRQALRCNVGARRGDDTQPAEAATQLVQLATSQSSEVQEGFAYLWSDMRSLVYPFYSHFVFWLLTRVGVALLSHAGVALLQSIHGVHREGQREQGGREGHRGNAR